MNPMSMQPMAAAMPAMPAKPVDAKAKLRLALLAKMKKKSAGPMPMPHALNPAPDISGGKGY